MNRVLAKLAERWLVLNSKNSMERARLNVNQARAKVEELVERGVQFHSPSKRFKSFRVRLGNPKMRARRHLTLPPHSLDFSLYEPSLVLIKPDEDNYEKWWDLRRRLSYRREDTNMPLSVHPHISADGSPCLGDYGRPFSTAVNQGNIPALMNISSAFLNTWTRVDCFWDVNTQHRSFERSGQMQGRKGMQFREWLYLSQMARAIVNDLGGNLIMRHFDSWMRNDETQEKLEAMGVTWEKALMAYCVYKGTLRYETDTEDKEVDRMHGWHQMLEKLYNEGMSKCLDEIYNTHKLNGYAWIEQSFTGVIRTGNDPFAQDRVFSIPNSFDGLKYRFNQFTHRDNESYPEIKEVLNARTRIYLTPTDITNKVYMQNDEVNRVVGEWCLRAAGMTRPMKSEVFKVLYFIWRIREFGPLFKQVIDSFNPHQIMSGWISLRNDDSIRPIKKREQMGEEYRTIINQMGLVLDNYDTNGLVTEFRVKFQVDALEFFQNYLKALYKGVTDDKRSKQIDAYGEPTRPNSPENQLSLDSF